MPKIKVKRTDILRKPEIDQMLEAAQHVYRGDRLQCIIALLWMFGKRINEILSLKREDLWIEGDFLYVYFTVQKKRTSRTPLANRYLKKIRVTHPYVQYVTDYIAGIEDGYVFASYGRGHTVEIPHTLKSGITVHYTYTRKSGILSNVRVWQLLKEVNADCYPHFFRESLATRMAEQGATEMELRYWFDWDSSQSASMYVKRGTRLTEKWSKREF